MESSQGITPKEEGLNLLKAGKIAEAIQAFEQGVIADSDNAQLHMYLGIAYSQQKNRLMAIRHLEESLNLKESSKGYYNLGLVYEDANRVDEAIRQYKMALELDPNYANAQNALNKLQQQYAAAHPELSPEPPADPDNPAAPWEATQQGGTTVAAPPKNTPPDWNAIQAQKEYEVKEAHKKLIRGGITYGAICGCFLFILFSVLQSFVMSAYSPKLGLIYLLIQAASGTIFGAIVGFWIGYTSGDDVQGALAGAAIAFVLGIIKGIFSVGALGVSAVIVVAIMNAFYGAISGYIIGKLVESSIQQI